MMSTVQEIETAILKLSLQERQKLTDWLLELDEQAWDEQIERDVKAGKLDALAQAALQDFAQGNCQPL